MAASHQRVSRRIVTTAAYLVAALAIAVSLLPVAPLFIHLFIPFPNLNETTHWVGRVEVVEMRVEGNQIRRAQLFVVTADGKRNEFACGVFGDRYGCPRYAAMHGAVGEVWFSRAYGAVQWRLTLADGWQKGVEEVSSIEEWKDYYDRRSFPYEKYLMRLALPLLVIAAVSWQLLRRRKSTGN